MKGFHIGIRRLCSVLLGLVFFVSGMLKLMDPTGTGLIVEEYLKFFHLGWITFGTKAFGVFLSLVESLTGAALLAGVWRKQTAFITSFLTIGFTIITFLLLIFNPNMDCGCFGEAIHLTHLQSFIKNIFLCALCAGAFLPAKEYAKNRKSKVIAFALVVACVLLFAVHSLVSIPLIDFTEFAPGSSLAADYSEESPDGGISFGTESDSKEEYYVIYEKNGKEGAFTLDRLPDSTWTFVRVETMDRTFPDYESSVPLFYISDSEGEYQNELLTEGKVMVVTFYEAPGKKEIQRAVQFMKDAEAAGFTVLAVSREPVPGLDTYQSDFKKLITFNRSNGGATYLKDGEIISKWPSRNLPDAGELAKIASTNTIENLIVRSSRRRITFQSIMLYSLAILLIL